MNTKSLLASHGHLFNTVLIAILCVSCSVQIPRSTVQYVDPDTNQVHEFPVIIDETEGYKLEVEPRGNVGDNLIFDIGVTNKNLDTLYVDPRDWQLYYSSLKEDHNITSIDTLQALTPVEVSQVYAGLADKLQSAEDGKQAATVIVGLILIVGVLVIALKIAEEVEEDDEECCEGEFVDFTVNVAADGIRNNARSFSTVDDEILYYRDMSNQVINDHLRFHNDERMLLLPGEQTRFDLYFKRKNNMKSLKLRGGFNGQVFEWEFNHYLIAPTVENPR
ncbi:MAG: hypothetical protein ABJ004_15520 [Cyclobacteriaceae bacterium]